MALYTFHRILIAAAIFFDFIFTLFCVRKFNANGNPVELVWGGLATLIVVALVGYLIVFNRKTAILQASLDQAFLCPNCRYDLRGSIQGKQAVCPECGTTVPIGFRRNAATV